MMDRKCSPIFTGMFLLTLLLILTPAYSQEASISEFSQEMRTYPFGDPDPVPRMGNIYPYFRFDGYSVSSRQLDWKVVKLENPYIAVSLAPEIGGKILGAIEKSTGKEFIYYNKVVKFRQIAMRGPWTSGGIEFNFGAIGHTPTTSTPVDYLVRENSDGSVSCFVGALDLPSRTEWRVEVRLAGDKAFFETRSFWYNPTDLNTSLYHWMNAAADGDDDLRLDYPGAQYIDHGGNAFPWPVDSQGRRLDYYRNNIFGSNKSYHVLGTYTDFFGIYWESAQFGLGHWSRYTEKPGKKIWMWVLSREGQIWRDLLTDADLGNKQYVEIQTGLLFNQAARSSSQTPFKHQSFAPQSSVQFSEIWFPVKNIGGLKAANEYGGLFAVRRGGRLVFGFCPIQPIAEPLTLRVGGTTILQRNLNLQPMESFIDSIDASGTEEFELSIGHGLLTYREGDWEKMKLGRPTEPAGAFEWDSPAGLYLDGLEKARQRDYQGALSEYRKSAEKDPYFVPSLVGLAETYYRRQEDSLALGFARRALAVDTYDAEANFVYGLINRRLGRVYDARDGFGIASLSMKFRSAAHVQLGEMDFMNGDLVSASEHARQALRFNTVNIRAYQLLALVSRKGQKSSEAREGLDDILRIDPLNHFATFELYLLTRSKAALDNFDSRIRNELPHETYLELASYYFNLQCWDEAQAVLNRAPAHPIVLYWQAYIHAKKGESEAGRSDLADALDASPSLVFPFRPETASVLEWALTQSPHWKTRYYLALIRWNQNRSDIAGSLLRECRNDPGYAPFYLARGVFAEEFGGSDAEADYRRAFGMDPGHWRPHHSLARFYEGKTQYSRSLELLSTSARRFPDNYVIQVDYARSLLFSGKYRECLDLLDTLTILPFEGARYGREMYRQANVMLALDEMGKKNFDAALLLLRDSQEWPENLGVGRPYDVDQRLESYLESICLKKTGHTSEARRRQTTIVKETQEDRWGRNSNLLLAAWIMRNQGSESEARALLDEWKNQESESIVAQWCLSIFAGTPITGTEIKLSGRNDGTPAPWNPVPLDPHFVLVRRIAASGWDLSSNERK